MQLLSNIRFWILLATSGIIAAIWLVQGPKGSVFMVQSYGLWAAGLLLVTLAISPVTFLFPKLPYKPLIVKSRRALGVSAFLFAEFHSILAFTRHLGGFKGLTFLDQRYLVAIGAGAIASLILVVLTLTSTDRAVRYLGKSWKKLHRLIYLAGFLVLFHSLSIGSIFHNLATPTARFSLLFVVALVVLQAMRADKTYAKHAVGVFTVLSASVAAFGLAAFTTNNGKGISIHGQHAQQATQTRSLGADTAKRFSVSVTSDPLVVEPGKPVTLSFTFYDATSGFQVTRFTQFYEKFLHVSITDSTLTQFEHVNPEIADDRFTLTHTFAAEGLYHLYLNFFPYQAAEQQSAVTVRVGDVGASPVASGVLADLATSYSVNSYDVSISAASSLNAASLSAGKQALTYSVMKAGKPVTTLNPYLGAFGHLTLINAATYESVHAHAKKSVITQGTEKSGPDISFIPVALTGSIKPGMYRAFLEIVPDGVYSVVPFTLTIR